MRKHTFCICENKGADQLGGSPAAGQCLCLHYMDRTAPLLPKSKFSSLLVISVAVEPSFVSDQVRNPKDRFCRYAAHLLVLLKVGIELSKGS